ncbi:MAG: LysE family translocator [Planctomycetota bacterium]
MSEDRLLAFLPVVVLLTLSPGADTLLVLRNTLRHGAGGGKRTAWGVGAGLLVHGSLSALGVSALVLASAEAFDLLRILGAVYLVWLGLRSLARGLSRTPAPVEVALAGPEAGGARAPGREPLFEGFLTNLLNPKVALFYLAFLPQFVDPEGPVLLQTLALAGIHLVLSVLWLGFLARAIHAGRERWFRPRARRVLDAFSGGALIGLGLQLALERR